MTDEHKETPLRSRIIGGISPCEDSHVLVSHLYEPEGSGGECEHGDCHNSAHDPGMVDLYIQHGEDEASVQMLPGAALELANRLTRAANLVLETWEDVPDVEREAGRFGVPAGHEG